MTAEQREAIQAIEMKRDAAINHDERKAQILRDNVTCERPCESSRLHRVCAWCGRVLERGNPALVSHGICDECHAKTIRDAGL